MRNDIGLMAIAGAMPRGAQPLDVPWGAREPWRLAAYL